MLVVTDGQLWTDVNDFTGQHSRVLMMMYASLNLMTHMRNYKPDILSSLDM